MIRNLPKRVTCSLPQAPCSQCQSWHPGGNPNSSPRFGSKDAAWCPRAIRETNRERRIQISQPLSPTAYHFIPHTSESPSIFSKSIPSIFHLFSNFSDLFLAFSTSQPLAPKCPNLQHPIFQRAHQHSPHPPKSHHFLRIHQISHNFLFFLFCHSCIGYSKLL